MGREIYKTMADKILKCFDECFTIEGFYLTGHDADTEHKEGATYLWSFEELERELLPEEFFRKKLPFKFLKAPEIGCSLLVFSISVMTCQVKSFNCKTFIKTF